MSGWSRRQLVLPLVLFVAAAAFFGGLVLPAVPLLAQTPAGGEALRAKAERLTGQAADVVGPGLGTASAEDFESAAATAAEAAALWARLGERAGEARAQLHRAEALHFVGSLAEALVAARRSLELAAAVEDALLTARAAAILGTTELHLGDLDGARTTLEHALALFRKTGNEEGERATLHELAAVHRERMEWQAALEYQQQAATLAERLGLRTDWAGSLINLAKLYQMLGQSARAERDVETALGVARELGNERLEAWGLRVLGDVHRQEGELAEAQAAYEASLAVRRRQGDRRSEAMVLNQLAFVHMDRGDHAAALELYRGAYRIARELDDEVGIAATLGGVGEAQLALGQWREAHSTFSEELRIHGDAGRFRNQAAGLASMARASLRLGELERGLGEAEEALERLEAARREIADDELRAGFLEPKRRYFELAVDAHLRLAERHPERGHLERAFEVSEQARSRTLLEVMAESRLDASATQAERAVLARRQELHGEIAALQRELMEASLAGRVPARGEELARRLGALDDERRRLDTSLRPRLPALPPRTVTAAEAPLLLPDGGVLLEYLIGVEASFLFVHDGEALRAFRLPPEAELRSLVEQLRSGLERPGGLRRASYTGAAVALYDALIAPAAELLTEGHELLVVADGPLHLLPFEVLSPGVEGQPRYLVERWAVRYAPSLSVLASIEDRRASRDRLSPRLLALAASPGATGPAQREGGLDVDVALRGLLDPGRSAASLRPLPHAVDEVRDVARLFPAAQVLVEGEASEESLKRLPALTRATHLHFATHALVSDVEPDRSGLVLLPGAGADDGLLQVWEILDLDLHAELAVLSACETGLGREVRGEGIMGLSRAFLYAGTSSLVASLWQVHDRSTRDLMVRFYGYLQGDGDDPAQALRRAKLELIAAGYDHPFYWAPFVLIGG